MTAIENAVVVKNKTRLESLIERFNSKGQAKFYIEHAGGDFSDYEIEHDTFYRSLDIAASGMTAQRMRMDAISSNIANVSTTNADGAGNPYLRRHVVMRPDPGRTFSSVLRKEAIKLKRTRPGHMLPSRSHTRTEQTPFVEGTEIEIPNMRKNVIYDPSHPDADADGFVVSFFAVVD